MTTKGSSKVVEPVNYLVNQQTPEKKSEEFYDKQKLKKMEFGQVWGPQSHLRRRKFILQDHPEIAKLLVPSKPWSMILAVILVSINLSLAYLVRDSSWFVIFVTVYVFGGTINHTCHVLIHDFTHWAGTDSILINKAFAIYCNIGMGLPSAISFGIYHADHHNYLGEVGKDPDLPTQFQVNLCESKFMKLMFFILLSPIYALRPFLLMHKRMTMSEAVNFLVIICTDLIILKFWGWGSFAYILIGGLLSIGAHPAAIHVIAQHHEFVKGLETYDYFGIWNVLNLNLGYHIQHHDFPSCPWYNLPAVKAMAPEWYDQLPYHTSYAKVLWKFVMDEKFNLYHRTIRLPDKKAD